MSLNIIYRFTTFAALTCGIAFLILGSTETLLATSFTWTEYGSTLPYIPTSTEQFEMFYSSAPSVKGVVTAGTNVIVGTAFILVGLLFHAYITLNKKSKTDLRESCKIVKVLQMDVWRIVR